MKVPVWRCLGQLAPAAAIETQLYAVAVGRQSTIETLACCNQGAATTVRIRVSVAGAPSDPSQFLYYDLALQPNDTFVHRGPTRLGTLDEVWVESASGDVSFTAFGQEEFV